jgi:pimeloyl-ACP methyl ester carboxylesterase
VTTFVLIHGAFSGGWSWDPVRGPVEQAGHKVITPDLPSQGNDQTPLSEITLDSYCDRVIEVLDRHSEPVVLAGHSLGGISVSQAAERRPDSIKALVYVAAFLLPDGSSPKHFWGNQSVQSPVISHCDVSGDGVVTFRKEHIAGIIYNTSPQAAVDKAVRLQRPMARKPLGTPLRLSEENFGLCSNTNRGIQKLPYGAQRATTP